ncbi:NAD(P)H-dependent oxidoreductase [Variovorax arabinosiphilus]|uniref:NAD(P)H-dependent oxidoreductase n=1 Tax=Variovorax arabinosiphilus TaxID=3053498 RepID=UPI0025763B06|nr:MULTISPECIES: NAD(P)H-dependent oxidoreductase [unclassified Variovorax]MDM0120898.1 NAD(P)H-dependent oxidoreductase [Variovorax sp. J2L1-78]MDM0129959.1 NAD(P)H-dependent oxidoreductase [Variovorax sp. J2L1-63]MDM0233661.1 NAD(P)H-dependent oxidoreductase [Variovorax sp. J2R1-6]
MRVLVVYCHPVETSFASALHQEVLANLRAAGHEVDDCDLYAEGFDPVLSREERLGYHEVPSNRIPLQPYIDRLNRAEAIVFCFPTWCFGLPAMLKGFFDRLFMPGVAFDISDPANVKPMLTHIKRISAVVTYGRPRWVAWYMGDPPRKIVTRYMKRLTGQAARVDYHAHYHMNIATEPQLTRFKARVGQAMARFA